MLTFVRGRREVAIWILALTLPVTAAPVPFPETGGDYIYSQGFDSALGTEWTLNGWLVSTIYPGGAAQVSANGNSNAQIANSTSGKNYLASFPLAAIKAPDSYANHGFSGNWLINKARADDDGTATARLEFNNLPGHTSIDLGMLLAVGDSIDGGTGTNADGPKSITIKVDGVTVWDYFFSAGGNNLTGTGIVKAVGGGNLNSYYREQWNDNSGAGPSGPNDRVGLSWTYDSAYNLNNFATFNAIPHTADTLTIDFVHNLSSAASDEYQALENVTVGLNGVPEPASLPIALGLLAVLRRRHRSA